MSDEVIIKYNGIPKLGNLVPHLAGKAVAKALADIEANAKTAMSGSKGGPTYKRPGGKTHRASAPGEAPAIDEGDLAGSFHAKMTGPTEGELHVTSDHAAHMEFGTEHIAPRPFLKPSADKVKPTFVEAMERIVA
jgi:hypothetical protein